MRPISAPLALSPPATVGIVATSSPISTDELGRLVAYFHRRGCNTRVYPSTAATTGYLAGSASQRATDLMAAFADPDVTLIVPATGGKGAADLLPLLDYELIAAHPTLITGMSDPSILLNAIYACSGVVTLHGPSGFDFFQEQVHQGTEVAFWRAISVPLAGRLVAGPSWRVLRGNGATVSGRVVGGHLGTIRALIGTRFLPELDGAILIVEDCFVPWAVVDQALTHLRLAGVFDRIAALLVGVPVDCQRDNAPDASWDDLILRCVGGAFPIVTNIEFGHTPHKIPLPIGGKVHLDLREPVAALTYCEDLTGPL